MWGGGVSSRLTISSTGGLVGEAGDSVGTRDETGSVHLTPPRQRSSGEIGFPRVTITVLVSPSSAPLPALFVVLSTTSLVLLLLNVDRLAINTRNGNDTHNIQLIKAPASRPALAEH